MCSHSEALPRDPAGAVHIGTSGWNYLHWKGPFYPTDLPNRKWLSYYSERFSTVEVNNSFYKLPRRETFAGWRETAGDEFRFAVKASRFVTHMKKLMQPEEPVDRLMERVEGLGPTLGPILFQLPPRWGLNAGRLEDFLNALPTGYRYAMEFRDRSWWKEEVFSLLQQHNVAFCTFHLAGQESPRRLTADFAYVRLHGPEGPYAGRYSEPVLASWRATFTRWLEHVEEIFCYFDNDQFGYAPQDALALQRMVNLPDNASA